MENLHSTDAHVVATATVARALSRTLPKDRADLLIGFLHAAGSGLVIVYGSRGAAEHGYMLADHLATKVAE